MLPQTYSDYKYVATQSIRYDSSHGGTGRTQRAQEAADAAIDLRRGSEIVQRKGFRSGKRGRGRSRGRRVGGYRLQLLPDQRRPLLRWDAVLRGAADRGSAQSILRGGGGQGGSPLASLRGRPTRAQAVGRCDPGGGADHLGEPVPGRARARGGRSLHR